MTRNTHIHYVKKYGLYKVELKIWNRKNYFAILSICMQVVKPTEEWNIWPSPR